MRRSAAKIHSSADCLKVNKEWSLIDICCGLGGLSLAGSQLGLNVLGGVDLSDSALATFIANFPDSATIRGCVTKPSVIQAACELIRKKTTADRTLLVSGPPCQGFSSAGPRQEDDARNQILGAVADAVAEIRPFCAIIENVSTLLSVKHRHTLNQFRKKLEAAGYYVTILELNAADFGVPQRRYRMFCFASRCKISEDRLKLELDKFKRAETVVSQAFKGLPTPIIYAGPDSLANAIPSSHVAMRHSDEVRRKIESIPIGKGPMSYRKLDPNKVARTLVSGNRAPPAHYAEPRSITPREAARLQGFPDDFRFECVFSRQLLHITNAVPPPLAKAAIASLIKCIERSEHGK